MTDQGSLTGVFERVAARAQLAASHLHVRSALNPMLWLCGIVSVPAFTLSYFAHSHQMESLGTSLFWLGCFPVAVAAIGFLYFMVWAPEKLQSEDYQLRHESLELIKQKGSSIEIAPSSLDAITNPANPQVERGKL